MSLRSIIVGLLGALGIAGAGYINDQVLGLESIVAGHLLPIIVFGTLAVAVVVVNPLLFAARPSWRFRPAELATSVLMMLVACSIPARGLLETFTPTLIMPIQYNEQFPGWKKAKVLSYVPPSMLPAEGLNDPQVVGDFLSGLGHSRTIGLDRIPWAKWRPALATWMPLVLLSATCGVCLALIVHRQWATRERLRYPIADFATSLMAQEPARAMGPIFRKKLFWIGLLIVLSIRIINGLNVWYPNSIQIPLRFDFSATGQKWPILWKAYGSGDLLRPPLYPTVIAFSFFLASEVALSMGLAHLVFVPFATYFISQGVTMSGEFMAGGAMEWLRSGSYAAFSLILAYLGRRYYWQVLACAVTFRRSAGVEAHVAWACRVLILASAGMVWMFIHLGMAWTLAVPTFLLMIASFVVVSRIGAETGLFFIQPRWQTMGVLLGLLGGYALGIQDIVIVGLLCAVLTIDPSQALMPYVVQGLRICDNVGVRPARAGCGAMAMYVVALAVGLMAVLWANYNFGVKPDDFNTRRVPQMTFNVAVDEVAKLNYSGELEESRRLSPVQRILRPRPNTAFLWWAGAGAAMVLAASALRLRFTWWPLHPVIFLIWGTLPASAFMYSFLIGWLIKTLVTRIGGHRKYLDLRVMMIGVIAGDLLGALVFMVHGGLYYAVTGLIPPKYQIFPH